MARSFNGTSDKGVIGTGLGNPTKLTLHARIFIGGFTANMMVLCRDDSTGGRVFQWRVNASNQLDLVQFIGGVGTTVTGATTLTTGVWYDAAVVMDGVNASVWLNGANDSGNTATGAVDSGSTTPTQVGCRNSGGSDALFWNGRLAEIGIWNIGLTADELKALSGGRLPKDVRPGALLAYCPLWGLQSPEPDMSGNANGVTLTGTAQANHAPVTTFTRKSRTPPDVPAAPAAAQLIYQPNQRYDALPDMNASWWEQFRRQPVPITFQPPPPLITPARSQRIDPLPVFDTWWEQFKKQPVPITFLPFPPTMRQDDQRIDVLPNLWQEYDAYRQRPYPQAIPVVVQVPPAPSQQRNILPDYWQQWQVYAEAPFVQWFIPPAPPTRQPSQRVDQPPDLTYSWWEQKKSWPTPVENVPSPVPTHQASQRFDALTDYTSWWEQFRQQPLPITFVPTPFLRQASQRQDALPDANVLWWEVRPPAIYPPPPQPPPSRQTSQRQDPLPDLWQGYDAFTQRPYAAWYNPPPPATRQPSQRQDALPDYNLLWWEQRYVWPIPQGRLTAPVIVTISWRGITSENLVWKGVTNMGLVWSGVTG